MPAVAVETACPIPNPTGLVMESSSTASSADKKRNKLGYHRTSVACVHCRRRKIRCLVAADDAQGRCENCIRLRKECHFFPVDQQPPVEKRSRPGSKLDTPSTDPSTASSSPPALGAGGGAIDPGETMYSYQPIPLSSAADMSAFNPAAFAGGTMSPFSPDPAVHPEFVTTQSLDPSVSWDGSGMFDGQQMMAAGAGTGAATKPRMGNPSPVMWTQPGTPVAPVPSTSPMPGVAGVPGVSGHPQMMSPSTPYALQPDGSLWPPVQQPPQLVSQYPGQYAQQMPPDMKRRMTSPGQQNMGQLATLSPIQSPGATMPNMQGAQMPVNFASQATAPAMGFQSWTTMSPTSAGPGPGMEQGGYPMFPTPEQVPSNFPGQQQQQPMGHSGGQQPSSGQ